MNQPGYQVKIYLPDGNPDGVRIIHQMNWTGQGIVFSRQECQQVVSTRCNCAGVYILIGPAHSGQYEDRLYIGEAEDIALRFKQHESTKEFWSWAAVFISTHEGSLNKAHVKWLEHELYERAKIAGRCELDNANRPQRPKMHEAEEADASAFLEKVLQILPLVGIHQMQEPKTVASPRETLSSPSATVLTATGEDEKLVIIVPAREEGFEKVFLGEQRWYEVRIAGDKLDKIHYCAAYVTHPTSAITHIAPVDRIESFGESGKFQIIFSEPARELERPIQGMKVLGEQLIPAGIQNLRYTTLPQIQSARYISEL